MRELAVVGRSVPRVDGPAKATGQHKYLADLSLPGMLYGKILRSPYPHARIKAIRTEKASKVPGVRAVITYRDTPGLKFSFIPSLADKLPLCRDKVRYVGDEVAAVAAETIEAATEALGLIEVEYEELPAVFDPEEAMRPGAPVLHDECPNNVAYEVHYEWGNVAEAFAQSYLVVEGRYVTSKVAHCCMETRGCIAHFDLTGKLTVWSPTQAPHTLRQELARVLGLDVAKVRVIRTDAGGGFGSRLVLDMKEPIAALLSQRTRRPVCIVNTREEEFETSRTRYPYVMYLKTGVSKEGRILARELRIIVDNGAYNDKGPGTLNFVAGHFTMLYDIPNGKYDGYVVYTNKQFGTAMRGFGNPQFHFASEAQLDEIAERLGMDPMEIRLINANYPGQITHTGIKVVSCGLKECITRAAEAAGWEAKRKGPREVDGKLRGIGMAVMAHSGSGSRYYGYNATDAFIKIAEDGRVTLITAAPEMGQGSTTVLAQLAAEGLGVSIERIVVINTDTDVVPHDLGAYGSRCTFVSGNAVLDAANAAKQELLEAAGHMLGRPASDLEVKEEKIVLKDDPATSLATFEEVVGYAFRKLGKPLSGRGRYFDPVAPSVSLDTGYARHIPTYAFACQVAEVEVDPGTGEVKVVNFVAAHDTGRTVNPALAMGQIHGGVAQGIGYALTEELKLVNGKVINNNFLDYKMLRAADMPPVQVLLVETDDELGPLGAKGIGECGLVATAAAVVNAVYHATGVPFRELPLNPERVLAALKNRGNDSR